jgi:NADPH-dependent 2,4-dienoyl-CoA reductase/sulfur reductase-like enzyme
MPIALTKGRSGEINGFAAARHRVVLIGAGFGGRFAARGLKHAGVDVTVVDRSTPLEPPSDPEDCR